MPAIPPWCTPPQPLVGRAGARFDAVCALDEGPITLVGQAGVGTTVMGGAVLQALLQEDKVTHVVCLRVDGCTSAPDLIRDIGARVDAPLPGDESSVTTALHRGPPTAILLDDADLSPAPVRHVIRLHAKTKWVLTGREHVAGTAVPVRPLLPDQMRRLIPEALDIDHYQGLPLLTKLPEQTDPWDDLRKYGADAITDLPMGLTETVRPLPEPARLPGQERVVPRRSFREALGLGLAPTRETLARIVQTRAPALLHIACDITVDGSSEDIRLLRTAANYVVDHDLAAVAGAAAARIYLRFFQANSALSLVRDLLDRLAGARPESRGLLKWLEGDALLAQGSLSLAHEAHLQSAEQLKAARGRPALVSLARRCASQWCTLGHATRARKWLSVARSELVASNTPAATADTLRIAGILAVQRGDEEQAKELLDEAMSALSQGGVEANRQRASVLLAMSGALLNRGDLAGAKEVLNGANQLVASNDRLAASVCTRLADLAVRSGDLQTANRHLKTAHRGFRAMGSLHGLILCVRLHGDLQALQGNRERAIDAYHQAVALCVRTQNLRSVSRVLHRLLVVEQEGRRGPHVQDIHECLDTVELLMRGL